MNNSMPKQRNEGGVAATTSSVRYKAVAIDQLIPIPSSLKPDRSSVIADMLTDALNGMAADGWKLKIDYRSASGTIFIFEQSNE